MGNRANGAAVTLDETTKTEKYIILIALAIFLVSLYCAFDAGYKRGYEIGISEGFQLGYLNRIQYEVSVPVIDMNRFCYSFNSFNGTYHKTNECYRYNSTIDLWYRDDDWSKSNYMASTFFFAKTIKDGWGNNITFINDNRYSVVDNILEVVKTR